MITVGFIGLGKMGGPMAANLAKACEQFVCFDVMGTSERAPAGTTIATSVADVARVADTVFLSVPNGDATLSVVAEIAECADRRTTAAPPCCAPAASSTATGPYPAAQRGRGPGRSR
jgi:3-hydroxyisobutyrate dehydrogenase